MDFEGLCCKRLFLALGASKQNLGFPCYRTWLDWSNAYMCSAWVSLVYCLFLPFRPLRQGRQSIASPPLLSRRQRIAFPP